jgi:hypothetical protein
MTIAAALQHNDWSSILKHSDWSSSIAKLYTYAEHLIVLHQHNCSNRTTTQSEKEHFSVWIRGVAVPHSKSGIFPRLSLLGAG